MRRVCCVLSLEVWHITTRRYQNSKFHWRHGGKKLKRQLRYNDGVWRLKPEKKRERKRTESLLKTRENLVDSKFNQQPFCYSQGFLLSGPKVKRAFFTWNRETTKRENECTLHQSRIMGLRHGLVLWVMDRHAGSLVAGSRLMLCPSARHLTLVCLSKHPVAI